ncbi:MAG: CDP-archaeol synthase [Syntrophobacteraceae bacterium]|jgi:predicted MPP superfamily phosphohydrolase
MVLFIRLLILLWLINFAPPFLAQIFESKWSFPIDGGYLFPDGRPLFGRHKTVRGVLAGIITGGLIGAALGFPLWLGLGTGLLSMLGDLLSSFLKRRISFTSGDAVPGLDQVPEGLLPFILIANYYSLSVGYVLVFGVVFGLGAYFGSIFLSRVLLRKPFESYPRRIRALTRLRELVSCKITASPFSHILNFEDAVYYHLFMKSAFKALGIYERGKRNALDIEKQEVSFHFPDLPPAFDGYKLLFISDLHIDGLDGLTEKVIEIIRQTPSDMCILGGDYRMETYGPFATALSHLRHLLPEIRTNDGIVAVLGNHDCPEIVDSLKDLGVSFLVNDSRAVERRGQCIWIVGADDCHYFKSHDLESAFGGLPLQNFSILVSHSNEVYEEALKYRPNLFLCGHTHGGQILIPPFGPIFTHSKAPRRFCQGKWDHEGMPGYTSAGAGVSGVPVRFNSKGEVTVVTLRRSRA